MLARICLTTSQLSRLNATKCYNLDLLRATLPNGNVYGWLGNKQGNEISFSAHAHDGPQSCELASPEVTRDQLCAVNVGNKTLPHLPRARGGMSGQEQQERMHVTERQ